MPNIRVEFIPIQRFRLGWFGLDHMQLVYQPDELTQQDSWYVIEGEFVPDAAGAFLGVFGASGRLSLASANGDATGSDLVSRIGTPASRGSRILPIVFDVTGNWIHMADYGHGINENDFPYLGYGPPASPFPTFNSSSVIASLAWQAAVDINSNMPRGIRLSPGTSTYLGTTRGDTLVMPTLRFDTLAGGRGNDDLSGTDTIFKVDKLFGGEDDDTFHWSTGFNIINGGQPTLPENADGEDTIDYSGAGVIQIIGVRNRIPGLSPEFISSFTGLSRGRGIDWLYSIEILTFNSKTDRIILGENVELIPRDLAFNLNGEDAGGKGDVIDFASAEESVTLIADASDEVRATLGSIGGSHAWWFSDAEWVVGSPFDDQIHISSAIFGAEGGRGNDVIDARLVTPGTGASPQGFDAEIDGGEGSDTLISGTGRTLARGGPGNDRFVLSALSEFGRATEFVIEDATGEDRLLVPYSFFDGAISDPEGSDLMALLGGVGDYGNMSATTAGSFVFRTQAQIASSDDQTDGIIPFCGEILYYREGGDLVIHITPGYRTVRRIGDRESGDSYLLTTTELDSSHETIIRVRNFQPGQLGITFQVPIPTGNTIPTLHGGELGTFSNLDDIVLHATNGGNLDGTLDAIPTAPGRPDFHADARPPRVVIRGLETAETLDSRTDSRDTDVAGGGGDDAITTGAGNDNLDGGTGSDLLAGGAGDDTYVVDSSADAVVERRGEGEDTVLASIDYTITANVENLTLTGAAVRATGNSASNRIIGTSGSNVLLGLDGNDTLYGAGGRDTLIGGAGKDGYVYFANSGDITVIDDGPSSETDTLVLIGGIAPGDVSAYRLRSAPNDLVLGFAQGGSVTIRDYMTGGGVEQVTFETNDTWTRAELDALAAGAPLLDFPPPIANDDFNIAIYGVSAAIPALAFVGNDIVTGALRIVAASGATAGSVSVDANGDVVIAAPAGFEGEITFSYTVRDSYGDTATAHATVTILPPLPNTAPVAGADTIAAVDQDRAVTLAAADLLANDTDGDGDPLSITAVSNATHGTVAINSAGNIVFTPAAGYVGTATFAYTVSDGVGGTAQGSVTLTFKATGRTLAGTQGRDVLTGTAGNDTLNGLGGDDVLNGGAGNDVMTGGEGNDIYYVDSAGDQVIETNGDIATGGYDTVYASVDVVLPANVEVLVLTGAATSGTGNDGDNILNGLQSSNALTLDGGAGNDTIYGSAVGGNTLIGGEGGDTLVARGGRNVLRGGNGNDAYYISSVDDQVIETNTGGVDTVVSSIDILLAANVENLILNGSATSGTGNGSNNVLYGNSSAQALTLDGGAGNDIIFGSSVGGNMLIGGAGNDTIVAAGAGNTLIGGEGDDTFYLGSSSDIIVEGAIGGFDTLVSSANVVELAANVERLYLYGDATSGRGNSLDNYVSAITSQRSVTLDGGAGNDSIYGSTVGGNTLIGGAGDDTIFAYGAGNTLIGGDGNDIYTQSSGGNIIVESAAGGVDRLMSSVNVLELAANVEQLFVNGDATVGTGNSLDNYLSAAGSTKTVTLDGGAGNDRLYGSAAGGNTLIGGAGNDSIFASGAGNTLIGGDGNDAYYLASGTDIILEDAGGGLDVVVSSGNVTELAANVEQLILTGNATVGTGNGLDNYISANGSTRSVTLDGGAGNDTIVGSAQDDILTGGAGNDVIDLRTGGNDTMRYIAPGSGNDVVYGFDADPAGGQDRIDLSGRGFSPASLGSSILIQAAGTDTIVVIGSDRIQLVGVASSMLTAGSFRF